MIVFNKIIYEHLFICAYINKNSTVIKAFVLVAECTELAKAEILSTDWKMTKHTRLRISKYLQTLWNLFKMDDARCRRKKHLRKYCQNHDEDKEI